MEPLSAAAEQRLRVRGGIASFVVGSGVLALKLLAYELTGSAALLSDALESIVNVLAASFLIGSVVFAGLPADRNHPYGHGKIEYLEAAFEGGLISFAAVAILVSAARSLYEPAPLRELDLGLLLSCGASVVNLGLGLYLLRTGRRARSMALTADAHHVLSDVWTSVGVLVGLALVRVTGFRWLDPALAIGVGVLLAFTGIRLVRRAAGGLLDEEDRSTIDSLLASLERNRPPGLIRVHHLRALRAGNRTHVDAHLVMPEYWAVDRAHALSDALEQRLERDLGGSVDVMFHSDPCRREYCAQCEVADCPVRVSPFERRPPLTVDEAVRPDPPK